MDGSDPKLSKEERESWFICSKEQSLSDLIGVAVSVSVPDCSFRPLLPRLVDSYRLNKESILRESSRSARIVRGDELQLCCADGRFIVNQFFSCPCLCSCV